MRTRWVATTTAPDDFLTVPRLYVRLGPFRGFLVGWLSRHDWDLEVVAEQYVARFGGALQYRLRWLEAVLAGRSDQLLSLYLVDEVMTMLGHHPIEVYGDEWWAPSTSNGGGKR